MEEIVAGACIVFGVVAAALVIAAIAWCLDRLEERKEKRLNDVIDSRLHESRVVSRIAMLEGQIIGMRHDLNSRKD